MIEAAGVGRGVLFGFPGSAAVATMYAARRPERVSRLALWPAGGGDPC